MACCKCCCGNKDCAQGDQGKCCCGTTEKNCCTAEQYCCDGACQSTPCTGACCDPTFGCTQTADEATCTEDGGTWLGLGVPCDPNPCTCDPCDEVIRGTALIENKNSRPYTCEGPGYDYNNTALDTDEPCDFFAPSFAPCSGIDGVPDEYDDCDCMLLVAQCTTFDYDLGTDDNGNCCVATQQATTFFDYVYIYNESQCKWRLILAKEPFVLPSACNVFKQTAGCTAECPEVRDCVPTECLGSYDGGVNCECNEFI